MTRIFNNEMEKFIRDNITGKLQAIIDGTIKDNNLSIYETNNSITVCIKFKAMPLLHELMIPYYEMFLYADPKLFSRQSHFCKKIISDIAEQDESFAAWAHNHNLITLTESWADNLRLYDGSSGEYIEMLSLLVNTKIDADWEGVSVYSKEKLFQEEANGDPKEAELFCFLHGTSMIMRTQWDYDAKLGAFELFRKYWSFLRFFYSLMIRRIVGCNYSNFSQVVNHVLNQKEFHQHIEIFYCALVDRIDSLSLTLKQKKNIEKKMIQIQETMERTKPSEILYTLCNTLFPEDFQRLFNEHRPKTYDQLEKENTDLRNERIELEHKMKSMRETANEQIRRMAEQLEKAVEASIPIEDIERELMILPSGQAWDVFSQLSTLLQANPIWRKYDIDIRKKLLDRLNSRTSTVDKQFIFQAGSKQIDQSKNLYIDGPVPQQEALPQ